MPGQIHITVLASVYLKYKQNSSSESNQSAGKTQLTDSQGLIHVYPI